MKGYCRIYLFTYKRNKLLERAIESLVNQTFTHWVCEVHNDCPEDTFPESFIKSLNDDRFIVKNHPKNLGPTVSFNIAFKGCEEEYASILEDDNWWEPSFLKEMIEVMDKDRSLEVAWCNMNLWREHPGNDWENLHQTIWPVLKNQLFDWPNLKQGMGALHSNGAMIYRGRLASRYLIPENSLFNAVELIRERCFKHPIFLYAKPLANFSITLQTNQSKESWKWTGTQLMVLSSFVLSSNDPDRIFEASLKEHRKTNKASVVNFILANIFLINNKRYYKHFTLREWLIFSKWLLKNIFKINSLKNYLYQQENVYQFLLDKSSRISKNNH